MLEISFVQVFENFSKQLNFQSKKAADLILVQISPTPWPAIMSKGRGLYSCINYAKGGGAYTELHKLCQRGGAYTELHELCQRGGTKYACLSKSFAILCKFVQVCASLCKFEQVFARHANYA